MANPRNRNRNRLADALLTVAEQKLRERPMPPVPVNYRQLEEARSTNEDSIRLLAMADTVDVQLGTTTATKAQQRTKRLRVFTEFNHLAASKEDVEDAFYAARKMQFETKRTLTVEMGPVLEVAPDLSADPDIMYIFVMVPFFKRAPGTHFDGVSRTFLQKGLLEVMNPLKRLTTWTREHLDCMVAATFADARQGARPDQLVIGDRTHRMAEGQPMMDFYKHVCRAEGCAPTDASDVSMKLVRIAKDQPVEHLMVDVAEPAKDAVRQRTQERKATFRSLLAALREQDDLMAFLTVVDQERPKRMRSSCVPIV